MNADEYAATADAAYYWNQFPIDWRPDEPGDSVVGTVEHLGEQKVIDGFAPRIRIRTDDGEIVHVVATQTQLLAKLVRLKPKVGDRIKILFEGESRTVVPGFKPAHIYRVAVRSAVTETTPES